MKNKLFLFSLAFALVLSSCSNSTKDEKVNNEDQTKVGGTAFRKGDLFTEDIDLGQMSTETGTAPGSNKRIERSFENAPPLIPHKTEGLLPITIKNNMCISCHMPAVAKAVGATPLPKSHLTSFRPKVIKKGGIYKVDETKSGITETDLGGKLSAEMYNCNQCHVSVTNATLDVKNLFKPDFRNENSKSISNLNENITEGVK